jgi:hypothetical protein
MKVSVFVGTSVDGFIARRNGDFDFLLQGGGEPHGYNEFIASVDAIVMGRNTFEKVLTLGAWPYGDKRVVVLSSRPTCPRPAEALLNRWRGLRLRSFRDLLRVVPITSTSTVETRFNGSCARGSSNVSLSRACRYSSENGIPLFGTLSRDVRLRHVATRHYSSGLVQSEYHIDFAA